MKIIKKISLLIFTLVFSSSLYAQIFNPKDIISIYDPFTITFGELVLNTNDDEFKEHNFIVIVTITIGPEKLIKFFYKDDLLFNHSKNFNDDYWAITFTAKKNNVILIPALFNINNSGGQINIKMEGYSNLSPTDEMAMSQLSSSMIYTSSTMMSYMELANRYLATNTDINKPNSGLFTTAEVLQRNVSTRSGIFYLGNPTEVSYSIPADPKKVIGTNILIQGQKKIESKLSARTSDQWNLTFTKLNDVNIVKNEAYYSKIKGAFSDIINMSRIDENKREGLIARCNEIISEDLTIGRKAGVYINEQVIKQLTNLLNFLKASIRAKSDTAEVTSDFMKSDEREALTYMEVQIKENDFNLENQYVFDDYIGSSVSRGAIQKDIDFIRRYYQLK